MYHSQLGRFTSRDPIGYKAGVNTVEYVWDSPTNGTDPTGEQMIPGTTNSPWNLGPIMSTPGPFLLPVPPSDWPPAPPPMPPPSAIPCPPPITITWVPAVVDGWPNGGDSFWTFECTCPYKRVNPWCCEKPRFFTFSEWSPERRIPICGLRNSTACVVTQQPRPSGRFWPTRSERCLHDLPIESLIFMGRTGVNRSISRVIAAPVILLMWSATIGCAPEGGNSDELNRLRRNMVELQTRVDRLESRIRELQSQDPRVISDGVDAGMLLEMWESRQKSATGR